MDQAAKFWDKIAERYSKQPIVDEETYQKQLQITREYFQPDMEVLELGSGTGSTAIVHAPYVKRIRAIDISSKMIEIAQEKADAENIENIIFEQSTIDGLTVADQTLDVVLGLSVLHLLENKEAVISRVYKMLKPGGIFVSNTACLKDMMWFYKFIVLVGRFLGFMPLVKVFSTKELKESLVGAGFEIEYFWQPGKNKAVFIIAKMPE